MKLHFSSNYKKIKIFQTFKIQLLNPGLRLKDRFQKLRKNMLHRKAVIL